MYKIKHKHSDSEYSFETLTEIENSSIYEDGLYLSTKQDILEGIKSDLSSSVKSGCLTQDCFEYTIYELENELSDFIDDEIILIVNANDGEGDSYYHREDLKEALNYINDNYELIEIDN